jgi:hypothetical protein
MMPLCIDLFCGLGGWTEGFVAEGWDVIGFDIERHQYGKDQYPAQLVIQDVRTIHGSQFRHAQMIVASSPCQEFSYRAMPWKRAKALPPPYLGMELFAQAGRIQAEAIAAAGRFIPMIQENVRGAQPWVGNAKWHYGSYYLWGDVPALMPITVRARKNGGNGSWFYGNAATGGNPARGISVGEAGTKQSGISGPRTNRKGDRWFQDGAAASGRPATARKAASAAIAKIPAPLACHIARVFKPCTPVAVSDGWRLRDTLEALP